MITLRPVSARDAQVQQLLRALDDYMQSLYPPESNHLDSVEVLAQDNVHFLGAYADGVLVGCGAAKIMPGGYGELKRLYVVPRARGAGVGRRIIVALEAFLREMGIPLARLETGIHQLEILALCRHLGYVEIGPFGDYAPDPLSVFMEKRLPADAENAA